MKTSPLVSIVVIGRNEGERLTRCLRSIHHMHHGDFHYEVIYVDSDSRDDSILRAEQENAQVIRVKPERPSAALGRNAGWRAACAPFILFLDGDTILDPHFVSKALKAFDDPEVAVVWGHRREIHPEHSLFNRVLDLDWIYAPGITEFCGGDAMIRTDILKKIDGFDASLIAGEEPEMCQRIRAHGGKILHIDAPMTGHDLAMTCWKSYFKRAYRAGHAYAEISSRPTASQPPLWREDSHRNLIRGSILLIMCLSALVGSLVVNSAWPANLALSVLLGLVIRSAYRARWKSASPVTLLLYGFHSQIQQIPILMGQWGYWYSLRSGQIQPLIEYK